MRKARRVALAALTMTVISATFALASPTPAAASGVTTHAWMSLTAIDEVGIPELAALLRAHPDEVRAGAHFPDSGYVLNNAYGEEAHWQRYADAYLEQIKSRTDCGDITDPDGPCAPVIAHMMGTAAHGMGDEVWDWLFEPYAPDLDEYYLPDDFGSYASPGGTELQMDLVAIADHHQPTTPLAPIPSRADVLDAFSAVDFTDVSDDDLSVGHFGMDVVHQAEAFWAPNHIDMLRDAMPWMAANIQGAPGGIDFAAKAIAGYWEAMWGRLLGSQPTTEVSITYPADGERRIPAGGWVRSYIAGSNPGSGGARTRLTAALTYSRPYLPLATSGGSISRNLPAGSMTLTERDAGTVIPNLAGYPRSQPYGAERGHHLVDIQPNRDLDPCTWYRVNITSALLDARGQGVAPHQWDFRTGADASGSRCPDDPFTADELYVRHATLILLDRASTDQETGEAIYNFERGTKRQTFIADVLGSQEMREKLVTEAYLTYLGRAVDAGGLAYWSTKLLSISLPEFYARLIGSPEIYRNAGGTNRGYVQALFPLVLDRSTDQGGEDYWTRRLDNGLSRQGLAKSLLLSNEAARTTVSAAFWDILGRAADAGGLAYWTGVVRRGADPRLLWASLMASAEYERRTQSP